MPAKIESKESNIPQDVLHTFRGTKISPCEIILPNGVTMESGGMGTCFRVYGLDIAEKIREKFGFAAEYYPGRFTAFAVDWMTVESGIEFDDPRVLEIIEFLCEEAKKMRVQRPRIKRHIVSSFDENDDVMRVIYFRSDDARVFDDARCRMLRTFERAGGLTGIRHVGDGWGFPIDLNHVFSIKKLRDDLAVHDEELVDAFDANEVLVKVFITVKTLAERDALRGPMEVFERVDKTGMLDYLADRFVEFLEC